MRYAGGSTRRSRQSNKRRAFKSVVATSLVVGPVAGILSPNADAAIATHNIIYACYGDNYHCVTSYEFKSAASDTDRYNVDWMFDIAWYNNATVAYAKSILQNYYGFGGTGSTKYVRMLNGTVNGQKNYVWNSDVGVKNDSPPACTNEHAYMWAPNGISMYAPGVYGYMAFGSTHQDINEGGNKFWCESEKYGFSEDAERIINDHYASRGFVTYYDYSYVSNDQNGWDCTLSPYAGCEGNHYWQSDGYETLDRLP